MKIAINAKLLSGSAEDGISSYAHNICKHLLSSASHHEFHLVCNRNISTEILSQNFLHHVFRPRLGIPRLNSLAFSLYGFSRVFKAKQCDIAFIPWVTPFRVNPAVVTVHDLVPLSPITKEVDRFHHRRRANFALFGKIYAKRAALLVADSEDTKRAIQDLCGISEEKIRVVPLGVNNHHFYPRSEVEVKQVRMKYGLPEPYWISVASLWQPRKNLENLLQAFALFSQTHPEVQLIITGKKGPSYPQMLEVMRKWKLGDKVRLLEYVPYEELPQLLSGAVGLTFPSFHEGFGLPVLEAMSCGCPVICSDRGALPEVGGETALYVNPFDIDSIALAMKSLMENEELRKELRVQGLARASKFSWKKTADLTLKALEDAFCASH